MKRLYLITMALFVLSSALCGLAWDFPSLVVARILQGLGGGMLQPLGMAIVFSIVTPRERPQFMGLLGLPMLVAPLMGPTLGGFLVEYVDWHTVFTVNIPIVLRQSFSLPDSDRAASFATVRSSVATRHARGLVTPRS